MLPDLTTPDPLPHATLCACYYAAEEEREIWVHILLEDNNRVLLVSFSPFLP